MSKYIPLSQPRQTRVVHLAPGSHEDTLSGRIETVFVGQVSYEALSYEWGSPDRVCHFHVENGSIPITTSLHQALRDLRRDTVVRTVWADGICINQDDLNERAQQVTMMGDIYKNASRVLTYIGPEADGSPIAIPFAADLVRYAVSRYNKPDPRIHVPEELPNIRLPSIADPRWQALRRLLTRTWITRCWCGQEFLLNKNLTVMCGRTELRDWELFSKLVRLVFSRHLPAHILPASGQDPLAIGECLFYLGGIRRAILNKNAHFYLSNLLPQFHAFQATDPKDKIYSVLGLAADREALGITVDYTQTTEELYISVASRILTLHPDVNFLSNNLVSKTLDLPSWVPDWSTWTFGTEYVNRDWYYKAAGVTEPRVEVHGRKIEVSGCLITRITSLSTPIGPHYFKTGSSADRNQWLREQEEFIKRLGLYAGKTDLIDVLWRTLIADLTDKEEPATDGYRAFFEAHSNFQEDSSADIKDKARRFVDAARRKSRSRALARTERGYLGAVPVTSKVGDHICMFHGGRHLFVVREEGKSFRFVGPTYVHGLMQGEVLEADWYHPQMIPIE